jgi:hypothetical protein
MCGCNERHEIERRQLIEQLKPLAKLRTSLSDKIPDNFIIDIGTLGAVTAKEIRMAAALLENLK